MTKTSKSLGDTVFPSPYAAFCRVVALSTALLIFVGATITTTGSGLAVPDWPLSFGQVNPTMVGGVYYEHGHRLVASGVGFSGSHLGHLGCFHPRTRDRQAPGFHGSRVGYFSGFVGRSHRVDAFADRCFGGSWYGRPNLFLHDGRTGLVDQSLVCRIKAVHRRRGGEQPQDRILRYDRVGVFSASRRGHDEAYGGRGW